MTNLRIAMVGVCALTVAVCGCRRAEPVAEAVPFTPAAGSVSVPPDSPMLKQIRREPVSSLELATDDVIAPGKIEANPNRVSKVVAPVAGRVASVLVKVGDAVRQHQPLFTIESPDADAAMSAHLQADAAVSQSKATLTKAQTDADRAKDLFEHNAVAKKDLQSAENTLAQAQASLEQAEAAREQAKRRLSVLGLSPRDFQQQVVVRSPLSGKVLELSVVPGEYRNDTSAAVMTIADLSTVCVSSQVPETYIRFIRPHERVEISLIAYPDETFEGHVLRIADTVDPLTRTVKVQAEMDNPHGRFRPEMFGSIHHIESTARTPVVPLTAVIEGNGRSTVFVEAAPGRFDERAVVVGKKAGAVVRIVSGLEPGELIVVDGAMLLSGLMRKPA